MTIAALPGNTVCAITSSLVLHDAISVVKELIDNSLDAHATNILIEISLNALDIIQVKDNGSGIDLEDRQLLCKRGYTSKIRTLEDLAELGGTSLGFRGEALASAAELSESLSITTRVEGEPVGTLLKLDAKGKLISSSSASHGTGTTVKILNFLRGIPVRQQACQKKAPKIIAGIKLLLFDYAFARPTTRFQYKVLKSRADYSGNWSFAPSPNAVDLNLTLSKIVGKDIVKHCKQESNTTENGQYTLDTLVTADLHLKSTGSDQFVSVDGRPLNSNGNLMKDLNKIYKLYARKLLDDHETLPRRLFLAVRLTCPKGSYDINIEPTKDEVMFEDPAIVTQLFEGICKRVYGEVASTESAERNRKADNATRKQKPFEVLLARRPPLRNQNDLEGTQVTPRRTNSVGNFGTTLESSSESAPESLAGVSDAETNSRASQAVEQGDASMLMSDAEEGSALMYPEVTNPFVLAKLNTRIRPKDAKRFSLQPSEDELQGPLQDDQGSTPRSHSPLTIEEILPQAQAVSRMSIVSNEPTLASRMEGTADTYESSQAHSSQQLPLQMPLTMPSRVLPVEASSLQSTAFTRSDFLEVERSQPLALPFARSQNTGSVPGSLRRSAPQKPFRTPFKKSTQTTLPSGTERINPYPTPDSSSKKPRSTPVIASNTNSTPTIPDHISELDDIMEFEHRKRAHILQHKSQNQVLNKFKEKPNSSEVVNMVGDDFDDADVPGIISSKALYEARFNSGEDTPGLNVTPESAGGLLQRGKNQNNSARRLTNADRNVAVETNAVPIEEDIFIKNKSSSQTKPMHPNDPRALLLRNQSHGVGSLPTNRQSKARVAKLPFESIIAGAETYEIHAFLDQRKDINTISLAEQHLVLNTDDGYYAHCGKIKHAMDDLQAENGILETCKAKALQLMQEQEKQAIKLSQ